MQMSWVFLAIVMFIVLQACAVLTALKLRRRSLRENTNPQESEESRDAH